MNLQQLDESLINKRIAILGLGREGKALLAWLINRYPSQCFCVADSGTINIKAVDFPAGRIEWKLGQDYLSGLDNFDLIIKTPGIPMRALSHLNRERITSQTELFISIFGQQIIGITGTKGKSTTTSLIHHILSSYNHKALLTGNIGIPPFSVFDQITPDTPIIMELSSHQLELVHYSPHIAVFLNIFEEHLDHYESYADYQHAKYRVAIFQKPDDFFIYNADDERIKRLISHEHFPGKGVPFWQENDKEGVSLFEQSIVYKKNGVKIVLVKDVNQSQLKGKHNRFNLMAAAVACYLWGVPIGIIESSIADFKGLEQRLEPLGTIGGIEFYNDSISTVPEATLAAIESLGKVHTLLLGGFDRGIDYQKLLTIKEETVNQLLFTGEAGKRMMALFENYKRFEGKMFFFSDFAQMVSFACDNTPKGAICLLSPAAASYGQFTNFEHRGMTFKNLIMNYLT